MEEPINILVFANLANGIEKYSQNPPFVPTVSSCDIYNMIDPASDDKGFYTSSKYNPKRIENGNIIEEDGANVKIELQHPRQINRLKITAGSTNIPRRLSYQLNNDPPIVVEENQLHFENEPDRSITFLFDPQMVQTLTINTKNPNDEKDTWPLIKNIDIYSPESDISVFSQLINESEHHDSHRCSVFMSSSCFDTNHFYRFQPDDDLYHYHIVTHNVENSWFQVKLTKGYAILTGFKFQKIKWHNTLNYKIMASYDESSWTTLYEAQNEEDLFVEKNFDKVSPKVKVIKIMQVGKSGNGCFQFKFNYFDVLGKYFPLNDS